MICVVCGFFFFFQAEDGIRDAQESRGLGDVYKRQGLPSRSWCACSTVGRRVADTSGTTITTGAAAGALRAADSLVAANERNRGPSGRLRAARQGHRPPSTGGSRHRPRRPPWPASTVTTSADHGDRLTPTNFRRRPVSNINKACLLYTSPSPRDS